MLEPLGDPYTRFLPPAQYDSLYGLATGSVAGVGVSLFIDPVRDVFCPRVLSSRGYVPSCLRVCSPAPHTRPNQATPNQTKPSQTSGT